MAKFIHDSVGAAMDDTYNAGFNEALAVVEQLVKDHLREGWISDPVSNFADMVLCELEELQK